MSFLYLQKITLVSKSKLSFISKFCVILSFFSVLHRTAIGQDFSAVSNKEVVSYLRSTFPDRITNVIVDKNDVTIRGTIAGNQANLFLGELRMFDDTKVVTNSFASVTPINTGQANFEIRLKRFTSFTDTPYDRIYSRWVIAVKEGGNYSLQSFAHYAEDIDGAVIQYIPEEKPASKKGLAGFFTGETLQSDLFDLQIKNVTVNLTLPHWLSLANTEYSYRFNGQTYYFNPRTVNNFDKVFKTCSDNNIFVTGVITIPGNLKDTLKSIFVFARANGGLQSMANITDYRGLDYYAATIGFIAERYSRPDKKFGRISNYVIHNEVDNGPVYANAGPAQMEYYTELYDHSMRTAYYTIRQYNPAAKVFLSLTHSWATAPRPAFFAPKGLLNIFNEMSNKQGDYEWGVAYHPYPEDSFNPYTWNDKDATTNINTTKYITPKNIELIDQWMRMKSHLYKDVKVRTLLFSEQGIHSKSYNQKDLLDQAAGVAYMWKKFNRLPTLEAFFYYAQSDNRNEKGLQFGLWTTKLGTIATPDRKKPSWFVYQKAGTPAEDSAFAFALPIIGISNWSQVLNPINGGVMPATVTFNVTSGGTALNDVSIYFDGEMHKTINGKAIFYNVAELSTSRNYRIEKDGKLIAPQQSIVITKDQNISVNVSR